MLTWVRRVQPHSGKVISSDGIIRIKAQDGFKLVGSLGNASKTGQGDAPVHIGFHLSGINARSFIEFMKTPGYIALLKEGNAQVRMG